MAKFAAANGPAAIYIYTYIKKKYIYIYMCVCAVELKTGPRFGRL